MKLKNLLKNVNAKEIIGSVEVEISNLTMDSKESLANALFVCIKGENFDGHNFVFEAKRNGTVAIICEKRLDTELTQIIVENSRQALGIICGNFYDNPQRRMKIVGVTGTNGKTTVTYMIKNVLDRYGIKCGVIGTLGSCYGDVFLEPSLTTPDTIELFNILNKMQKSGVSVVIMEVSAHASSLYKVDNIDFFAGVFTNLSQDHLDYFITMEKYKEAKLRFLNKDRCKFLIVNADDELGRELVSKNDKTLSYGIENPADVFAIDLKQTEYGESFVINLFDNIYEINLKAFGKFNVYNALASMQTCSILGVPTEFIADAMNRFTGVEGRLQRVYSKDFSIFIDYAHTPDGLEKALKALKGYSEGKLICVFGCGGNRDSDKRAKMGEISARLADLTIITSDNPRFEEPMSIIREIEKGVRRISDGYVLIQDRKDAIKYSLNQVGEGDIILIAGKGSEKYQEVLGVKHPFDDKEIVEEFIKGS